MKVLLLRDYKEEEWHSMDVYADNLIKYIQIKYSDSIQIRDYVTLPNISSFFRAERKHMRHIFRYIINPIGLSLLSGDIFHITDQANAHLISMLDPRKTVVTCHDLIAPYWLEKNINRTIKKRIKFSIEKWRIDHLKRAAAIISVSESSKNEIVETLHIEPNKITVIPEGVEEIFSPIKNKLVIKNTIIRYKLPKKYILHVGMNFENKNIESLLKIFSYLSARDPSIYLVKVGQPWMQQQLDYINNYSLSDKVIHIGHIARSDLPTIYSLATLLIHPSHTEGFGFTVLEAMACGCPVVVSDIPALKELVGESGLYISPNVTSKDMKNIYDLLIDKQYRENLSNSGLTRSKLYKWQNCALQTMKVYRKIISRNS
jgi:glycosyltransferase involved in cell wall biosynthesis